MATYATLADVIALKGVQSASRSEAIESILEPISALIRTEAKNRGKDFDKMIAEDEDLKEVAKVVVADVAIRYVDSNESSSVPMSQMSQSVGGYSISGTLSNPGGGLYIKDLELRRLGLIRQKVGWMSLC